VADHFPVTHVARHYMALAEDLLKGQERIVRPSGWVGPVLDWVKLVNENLIHRNLGLTPCLIDIQPNGMPPVSFQNPESEREKIDWDRFWTFYADELRRGE
jgi:hypothetical protein